MDLLQGQSLVMKDCQGVKANYYLKKKKIIIYYFSASWVDDLELLGKLKQIYSENLKRHIGMEVVYVSSDTDERQFTKHFREHHGYWPGISPSNSHISELIRYTYNITCLPQIVVVRKEDGFIITRRGKEQLEQNGINVLVVWKDYESDLEVLRESQIELHYPQAHKVSMQPEAEKKSVDRKNTGAKKSKEEDDYDNVILQKVQDHITSFSVKRSTSKGM